MTLYKIGKIINITKDYVIFENNNIGELIHIPDVKRFKEGETRKIFISSIENEYSKTTYGFEDIKELILFDDLISLQGIGPKKAMLLLNNGWKTIANWLADNYRDKILSITYISPRAWDTISGDYAKKYQKWIQSNFDPKLNNYSGSYWENGKPRFE